MRICEMLLGMIASGTAFTAAWVAIVSEKYARWYLGASPSKKSVRRIKTKVSQLLTPSNKGAWTEVQARLNRLLSGWSAYFCHGALATMYQLQHPTRHSA